MEISQYKDGVDSYYYLQAVTFTSSIPADKFVPN